MMKNFKTLLFSAATLMLATACSSDEPFNLDNGPEATVTFTVDVPAASLATRARTAYADGTTATRLSYAVYKKVGDDYVYVTSKTGLDVIDLKASVSLNLLTNETYEVAFWAAAKDSPYTFSATDRKVTVDYKNVECNDESLDAFYLCKEVEAKGNTTYEIQLTRPFAQLNIGTSDREQAALDSKFTAYNSSVTVNAYTAFDLITGETDKDSIKEYTFAMARLPQGEKFPVDDAKYDYLAMDYLLMPAADQEVFNVTLNMESKEGGNFNKTYLSIPFKRNYRTNIYGQLLTTTNEFNVVIEPNPIGSFNEQQWAGDVEAITPDADGNYVVYNAAQLAWIATQPASTFTGKTIKIAADINVSGSGWTSINLLDDTESIRGKRHDAKTTIFDGQGHTIKGLNAPLILAMKGDIKNLTVSNVSFSTTSACQAAVVGTLYGTLSDVHVSNVTIKGDGATTTINCGGIVGLMYGETMTNCTAENVHITGVASGAGALIGAMPEDGTVAMTDCNLSNCEPAVWTGEGDVTMNGYKPMEKYPELFADDSHIYVFGVSGMDGLRKYLYEERMSNYLAKYELDIMEDIDCTGYTWESIWIVLGSREVAGFVLNGNNHTISNLTVVGSGLFGGALGNLDQIDGLAYTKIKDITFDNATIESAGGWHVGLFGQIACSLELENVHITNSSVTGACNVGGLVGSTGEFGSVQPTVTFTNCSVENCTLKATSANGADPTGASIFMGRALGLGSVDTKLRFKNCSEKGNTCINASDLVGGGIYGHANYTDGWVDIYVVNEFKDLN